METSMDNKKQVKNRNIKTLQGWNMTPNGHYVVKKRKQDVHNPKSQRNIQINSMNWEALTKYLHCSTLASQTRQKERECRCFGKNVITLFICKANMYFKAKDILYSTHSHHHKQ